MSGDEARGILTRADGATIAYARHPGKMPGVIFLHGFKSNMNGEKALAVDEFCRAQNRAFARFDAFGHGESSGDFEDGTIGRWAADAVAVIDELTEGPQIIVGSSMGGWLMLLAAIARPKRIAGLLGLAAAPDFTEARIWRQLAPDSREKIQTDGKLMIEDCYGGAPYPITLQLIEEGRRHLLLGRQIPITCPVRLIHGQQDQDVPWGSSLRLQRRLKSADVEVTFIKSAGHRLSEANDITRMIIVLENLIETVQNSLSYTNPVR
jgi:pimeloyl-ACP methyl ester carboxylesterase